jgi:predicted cupin superfamily sugar epimerase
VTATEIIAQLSLQPHPEGGWYREFYRSKATVRAPYGERCALTSIHFLLEQHQLSRWHVVESDEIWHFYQGQPLELLAFDPEQSLLARHTLSDAGNGTSVAVIPPGVWQAARSLGAYSLVGCSVAPGFEFADFRFVRTLPNHVQHFKGTLRDFAEFL